MHLERNSIRKAGERACLHEWTEPPFVGYVRAAFVLNGGVRSNIVEAYQTIKEYVSS